MPNENDRCVVACAIARGDLAHNRVSFSVIVYARVDAMLRDRRGELIHAKQKYSSSRASNKHGGEVRPHGNPSSPLLARQLRHRRR